MWCRWCIVYRMNIFTSYHYVANSLWHQVKHSLHNVTTSKHSVLLYTFNSYIYISCSLKPLERLVWFVCWYQWYHWYICVCIRYYIRISISILKASTFAGSRALFVSDYSVVCFILNGQTFCTTWHTKNPIHIACSTIQYCKFSMNCPSLGIAVSTKRCLLWNKLLAEKIRPLGFNSLSTSPEKFWLIHPNDKYLTAEWFNEAARTRDTGLQLRSGLPVRWKWLTRPNQWGDGVEKLFLGNLFEIVCTFEVQVYVRMIFAVASRFETNPTGTSTAQMLFSQNHSFWCNDLRIFNKSKNDEEWKSIKILIFLRGRACTPRRFRKVIFPTSQLPF